MSGRARNLGFSIAELLVVGGILALLLGLIVPVVSRARAQATAVECRAQLYQIGQMVAVYASDNKGYLPIDFPWGMPHRQRLWPELLFGQAHPKLVVCPTGRDVREWQTYMMNVWLIVFQARLSDRMRDQSSSNTVLLGENKPGANYAHSLAGVRYPDVSYDRARHGRQFASNYLWLDLHVSNLEPVPRSESSDPWYVIPASW